MRLPEVHLPGDRRRQGSPLHLSPLASTSGRIRRCERRDECNQAAFSAILGWSEAASRSYTLTVL